MVIRSLLLDVVGTFRGRTVGDLWFENITLHRVPQAAGWCDGMGSGEGCTEPRLARIGNASQAWGAIDDGLLITSY